MWHVTIVESEHLGGLPRRYRRAGAGAASCDKSVNGSMTTGDLLVVLISGSDHSSIPMGKSMLAAIRLNEPQTTIRPLMNPSSQANALRPG